MSIKLSYPNVDDYQPTPGAHNLDKWLQTAKELYTKEHQGTPRNIAFNQLTNSWKPTEALDFSNWLKYYQGNNHMKYKKIAEESVNIEKFSQTFYEGNSPGYFFQVNRNQDNNDAMPGMNNNNLNNVPQSLQDAQQEASKKEERKLIIEQQRSKIISRLDSVEKLLRSPSGQIFADNELEQLMEAIFSLKKKVQLVNKLSTSTRLYDDLIVRQANILHRNGFEKASNFLHSFAQANNPPTDQSGDPNSIAMPLPNTPEEPTKPVGQPGGGPRDMAPGMPQGSMSPPSDGNANQPSLDSLTNQKPADPNLSMPASTPTSPNPMSKGMQEFLKLMDTGGKSAYTDLNEDNDQADDLEVFDQSISASSFFDDNLLVSLAQEAPASNLNSPSNKPAEEIPLEVNEEDLKSTPQEMTNDLASEFDKKVDQVFSNITVADIVAKLEDLAKIFKTREVPRQLSIVDMMLDSLGLASFFPELSEATKSSLDSNNYISSRVEDTLSKLRGALVGKELDLQGDQDKTQNSQTVDVRQKLQNQEQKEKERKQMRKNKENSELEEPTKIEPNIEMTEDLSQPTNLPTPKKPTSPLTNPAVV